ncbi:uncharacterized protein BP5553_05481 [Venustampulla echinocandica]|uniref:Survival Motor Neuron Gemin2-binding domain-containing protein n=1 Tax=Venustampulla echinocandica TaxID=2656787 RepID=A0A370TRC3_9HELO|nr:uncharacterized protein BP5553_05481 [Venustampulla echinocandica]RDL38048.1 hypothetical protein BP5553_05481 [Venustampulla echinocandica]
MTSQNNPTHDEIWDDSLLVNSWNEALEEYKKYHSIQARGEDIDSVLEAHENQSQRIIGPQMDNERPGNDQPGPPLATSESHAETDDRDTTVPGIDSQVRNNLPPNQGLDSGPAKGPALPQHLMGQVRDEGLKNLLMSWYYAGYYTGLHEGKQQGMLDKNAKHEN